MFSSFLKSVHRHFFALEECIGTISHTISEHQGKTNALIIYLRGMVIGPRLGMFWVIALWWAVVYAKVIGPRLAILHNIGVMDAKNQKKRA